VVKKFLDDIDEIFNFMLCEHVVKYYFDDGNILAYFDLWIE